MPDELRALLLLAGVEKRVKVTDRDRPLVAAARAAIQAACVASFAAAAEKLALVARGLSAKVAKAAADDHDHDVNRAAEALDETQLQEALQPQLEAIAKDAARLGLEQVLPDALDAMLSQANARAVAWAEARAGELVTQVSETTREKVRDLVKQALAEGWSNDDLADELTGAEAFSDDRAEMIARTETAAADVAGSLEGWKESGVVAGKEWIDSADACDECQEMAGVIVPLDEDFDGGDPPRHPRCECDVLPVLSKEEEE